MCLAVIGQSVVQCVWLWLVSQSYSVFGCDWSVSRTACLAVIGQSVVQCVWLWLVSQSYSVFGCDWSVSRTACLAVIGQSVVQCVWLWLVSQSYSVFGCECYVKWRGFETAIHYSLGLTGYKINVVSKFIYFLRTSTNYNMNFVDWIVVLILVNGFVSCILIVCQWCTNQENNFKIYH